MNAPDLSRPDSTRLACSVVVPFFNEEPNVAPLLAEVRVTMDRLGQPYEVLAIDDGSADGTRARIETARAGWPELQLVALAQNSGQAAALLAGMAQARGAAVVTLDGDGQNDPADIPALLARLSEADLVAGVRTRREDSELRRVMSRVANGVRGRFLRDGVSDSGCALKAFRREVIGAFLPIRTLYSFMPALAVAAGFRVVEQSVNHRPRTAGVSKYGFGVMLWRPLVDMLGVRWFAARRISGGPKP